LLVSAATTPKSSDIPKPCTIRSPTSHAFFDLNPLHIEDPTLSKSKHPRDYSWNTTGWGLGYNFSMNFCGPVVEELEDVDGLRKDAWRNVSAYYKLGGKVFSIGQMNTAPVFHGRKLVLNYTDGSPCDTMKNAHYVQDLHSPREIIDDDPDDDDDDDDDDADEREPKKPSTKKPNPTPVTRRKNTIVSFLCDREPLNPLLSLSFVGASPDECTYMFEARSSAACGGIEVAKQSLSPAGVFGVIVLIAVIVYVVGGCVYSRVVLQQRGWRQMPNYNLWAGCFGFVRDIFIILTSSCARFLPSRRGYTRVNGGLGGSGSGRGRGRDSDAENRLIDDLNEEWDE
ncbi:hypothetical protein BAUCODRAFT_40479, partial [Baudoinia panamericana UAMH 10762]